MQNIPHLISNGLGRNFHNHTESSFNIPSSSSFRRVIKMKKKFKAFHNFKTLFSGYSGENFFFPSSLSKIKEKGKIPDEDMTKREKAKKKFLLTTIVIVTYCYNQRSSGWSELNYQYEWRMKVIWNHCKSSTFSPVVATNNSKREKKYTQWGCVQLSFSFVYIVVIVTRNMMETTENVSFML